MENINSKIKQTYDKTPYKSKAFSFSSAIRLEAVGKLFSINTPSSQNARVLEIGCSYGGNIISQAFYNENSYYVGIDLSSTQINEGKRIIEEMGLTNIELHNIDILEFDYNKFGKFDYIICHGVYSWVPDTVKNKILEICDKTLTENGLAYISYNALPGWRNQILIRDIMKYSNKYFQNLDGLEQVNRGKIILEIIKDERQRIFKDKSLDFIEAIDNILEKENYYLLHEYLEEYNTPLYVYQFDDQLVEHNLKLLCDSNLSNSYKSVYPQETQQKIEQLSLGDNVIKEAIIDYVINTMFKRSIIGRKETIAKANFSEIINYETLNEFYFETKLNLNDLNENNILRQVIGNVSNKYKVQDLLNELEKTEEYIKLSTDEKKVIKNTLYTLILKNIIVNNLHFSLVPFKTEEFNPKYHKLSEKTLKFFKTFDKEENNIITQATRYNESITLFDKNDNLILNLFDGIKDEEQIKKEIIRIFRENAISIRINEEIISLEEGIDRYYNSIISKINLINKWEDK